MALRIGEICIQKKLITLEQLDVALKEQALTGKLMGEVLIQLKMVLEEDLLKALAEQFSMHFVNLDDVQIDPLVLKTVSHGLAEEHQFMPIGMRNGVVLIAVSNPLDMWPMSVLQKRLGLLEVQTVLALKMDIRRNIQKYYQPS